MAAVAQRTRVGLRETGRAISIPDDNRAKLMYYLDCMCYVLEMDNTGEMRKLRNYRNYYLNNEDLTKLLIFCLLLSPDELNDKCIFQDDDMCGSQPNKFYELSAVNTTLLVSESIVLGGERKRVKKIMTYKAVWITNYFILPLASFHRELAQIRDGLESASSSSSPNRRALPPPTSRAANSSSSNNSSSSDCCCTIL